ncbi:hypothetical protein [Arthrobacter sp. SLBN-100]|uniref:hypothetical protein n=1 Tax=Arthrobacter sp. SLBN-100 TaxID=2768450 RepID=UPI001F1F6C08|nr:hypothetical protein [Arthrobacter sp. SLBN-100]
MDSAVGVTVFPGRVGGMVEIVGAVDSLVTEIGGLIGWLQPPTATPTRINAESIPPDLPIPTSKDTKTGS